MINIGNYAEDELTTLTLLKSYAAYEKDRAKYLAIGESSRMTLKFVKP